MVANLRLEKQVKPEPATTVYWRLPADLVAQLDRRVERANKLNPRGGKQSRSRLLQEFVRHIDLDAFRAVQGEDVPRKSCSLWLPKEFEAKLQAAAKRSDMSIHQFVGALLAEALS